MGQGGTSQSCATGQMCPSIEGHCPSTGPDRPHMTRNQNTRCFVTYGECDECGTLFAVPRPRRFCSQVCQHKSGRRVRRQKEAIALRHPDPENAIIEIITIRQIVARQGLVCGICGGPLEDRPYTGLPDDITIDHIVPYSEGGHHTLDNVRLAHNGCNASRGVKEQRRKPGGG